MESIHQTDISAIDIGYTPGMENLHIVKLKIEDWQAYKDIRLEALKTEPQAFGASYEGNAQKPDEYWRGRLEDAARGEKSWLLFAKANDRLIGMIGAFAEDVGDSVEPHSAEIISVYVTPAERGKGAAKALMTAILQELSQKKTIRTVVLAVNVHQIPAIQLYKCFGFQITGKRNEQSGDGAYHQGYLMERTL